MNIFLVCACAAFCSCIIRTSSQFGEQFIISHVGQNEGPEYSKTAIVNQHLTDHSLNKKCEDINIEKQHKRNNFDSK
jgi:hypothetical protein